MWLRLQEMGSKVSWIFVLLDLSPIYLAIASVQVGGGPIPIPSRLVQLLNYPELMHTRSVP